jgi:alpha-1,6-mannosyltransferase
MAPKLRALGVDRIESVPCGVDIATFNPGQRDSKFRQRLGIPPDRKILLYVGRLSPEKEIDLLLRAYACLSAQDYTLLIVGDGPESEAVKRHCAGHRGVKYLGSHRKLARVYASSDVFIMPCRNETFGMATMEALASGLPVVGIAEGASRDLITPEIGALGRPGDGQDLANKISAVAQWNLELVRERCQAYAATRYSWESVFARYFEIYRNLISDRACIPS